MNDKTPTNPTNPTTPITLTEAAALCPKLRNKRLHVSTLWRWCRRGVKARNGAIVRLEHGRVGGTLCTTQTALNSFFDALAAADLESFRGEDPTGTARVPRPAKPTPDGTRRAAIARAKKTLEAAGI